jgi:hypothetical protein
MRSKFLESVATRASTLRAVVTFAVIVEANVTTNAATTYTFLATT